MGWPLAISLRLACVSARVDWDGTVSKSGLCDGGDARKRWMMPATAGTSVSYVSEVHPGVSVGRAFSSRMVPVIAPITPCVIRGGPVRRAVVLATVVAILVSLSISPLAVGVALIRSLLLLWLLLLALISSSSQLVLRRLPKHF